MLSYKIFLDGLNSVGYYTAAADSVQETIAGATTDRDRSRKPLILLYGRISFVDPS